MSGCGCEFEARNAAERRTLRVLLGINALMFFVELGAGWYAQSTGLMADALDMFADALVYGLSLWAVGRAAVYKARTARISGWLQVALGLGVLVEVARRFVWGSEPEGDWMLGIGLLAFAANVTCLALLARHREGEVHMRASWIFSANDVLANMGVMVAGVLVDVTETRWPDLLIGLLIAALVVRGGVTILREARAATAACQRPCGGSSAG